MNNIKNIIFDYDGTLHNSIKIYAPAFRKAYKYLVDNNYAKEKVFTDNEISKWLGYSSRDMWNNFMKELDENQKQKASSIIGSSMIEYLNEGKGGLYSGAINTLEYAKSKGFNLIFLSNCKLQYMNRHRETFNLDKYFTDFYCTESFDFIPKYDIFSAISINYQGDFLIIGDRFQDIEIATKNNLLSIGCSYGYGSYDELKDATFVVNNILEIKDIIDRI